MRGAKYLHPQTVLAFGVMYLSIAVALLVLSFKSHRVGEGLLGAAFAIVAAAWLTMYFRKRNRQPRDR